MPGNCFGIGVHDTNRFHVDAHLFPLLFFPAHPMVMTSKPPEIISVNLLCLTRLIGMVRNLGTSQLRAECSVVKWPSLYIRFRNFYRSTLLGPFPLHLLPLTPQVELVEIQWP